VPLLRAEGHRDFLLFQSLEEGRLGCRAGTFPSQALDVVVGDQVNLGFEAPRQRGQRFDLFQAVVQARDQDIFEGDHPSPGLLVILASGGEFGERVLAIDGHDLVASLVKRAVQRNRQPELLGLVREPADLGGETAG